MHFCDIICLLFTFFGGWVMSVWDNALSILELDSRINKVVLDSILKKIKTVKEDDGFIVLSCRDEYSMSIAKEKTMTRTAGYGKKITPNYQAFTYFKKPVDFGYVPSRKELGRYKVMRRNIR